MSELTKVEVIDVKPKMTPAILKEMDGYLNDLIVNGLEKGLDYGTEEGIKTPFLKKPGAEKLCLAYGLTPDYEVLDKTVDHEFVNTFYSKKYKKEFSTKGLYTYEIKCILKDENGRLRGSGIGIASSLESKYCYNPKDVQNTLSKMAQKRALVAATLQAFALSNRFTQDLDDIVENNNESTTKVRTKGYDPHNKKHQDALIKELEKRSIPTEEWDKVGFALSGRSITDLDSVIKEVIQ